MKATRIDYIEFKSTDLAKTKAFYTQTFGWSFTDYGPTYIAFSESGVAGGFELTQEPINNGALIVLYHEDLVDIKAKVLRADGTVTKDIFEFPGGKRFHFTDSSGNELAIWSEK